MIRLFKLNGIKTGFPNIEDATNLVSAKYYSITQIGPNLPINIKFFIDGEVKKFTIDPKENPDFFMEFFDDKKSEWIVVVEKGRYLSEQEPSSEGSFFINLVNFTKNLFK